MNELRQKIADCDNHMLKLEEQINAYVGGDKERQLKWMQNECKKEERELKRLQKKLEFDEVGKTQDLIQKIKDADDETKDLMKEIKLLKRLQHHQGNRLVDMEDHQTFPHKIQGLLEEKKFHLDKNRELMIKVEKEKTHMVRQQDILAQGEKQIQEIQKELLPMSSEDIEETAIDPEDKETLTEIMEQNLVLKVLEKELKQ